MAAKSTFCRKCQQHYNLERMLAGEKSIVKEPSLFSKLTRFVLGDREREVTCFTCGHKQKLSKEAQSTMCPGCGAYMDLRDFKIAGPFGRSVQTAGDVYVTSKGDVTSTRLMCGSVYLEGSLRGCIICTGTATLRVKGRLSGSLESAHVLVDKKSEIEFPRAIHTKLFEVSGKARGEIVADKVVIHKGGVLEGVVHAKAITVDKGGIFTGALNIGGGVPEDEVATEEEVVEGDSVEGEPGGVEPAEGEFIEGQPGETEEGKTGDSSSAEAIEEAVETVGDATTEDATVSSVEEIETVDPRELPDEEIASPAPTPQAPQPPTTSPPPPPPAKSSRSRSTYKDAELPFD